MQKNLVSQHHTIDGLIQDLPHYRHEIGRHLLPQRLGQVGCSRIVAGDDCREFRADLQLLKVVVGCCDVGEVDNARSSVRYLEDI